jgi:3-oxoadipate enol-lactonase / 4-carboxymuconolactone decarboxylase
VVGAEFVQIPRAGHLINIERPVAFGAHLLGWLDRHAGAPPSRAGGSSFEAGLANRKAVLGVEYVEASIAKAGPHAAPFQDFITRAAWGDIWGDPRLPRKTRSMLVLATCVALNREEEFKLHLRPALRNGVTLDELSALMMQSAIYAGVPAANGAFRWTREALGAEWTG